jgi:uncharacterized protein
MPNKETKKIESARKQKGYLWYGLVSLLLVVMISTVIGFVVYQSNKVTFVTAQIGTEQFTLEVADTHAARSKGLSERDGLGENQGMLFNFMEDGRWRMWMVQMRFPIDIAWLGSDKKVVYIKHNATPAEYPETYDAKQDARYVIEVPTGTFERLDVNEGDSISF